MNKIRSFMKKHPLLYALLGISLLWLTVRVLPSFRAGALTRGVNEIRAAILVLFVYWLLSGRTGDLRPDFTGFSYGFRIMRYIFIILFAFSVLTLLPTMRAATGGEHAAEIRLSLLNYTFLGLAVGIVEEFTCRAMLFGGLIQVFGRNRKAVILAAAVSAFAFGFVHVASEVFTGEINDLTGVYQVIGKTLEAGVIGFAFALIYFKNRSIWSVVALHSLFDLILMYGTVAAGSEISGYVQKSGFAAKSSGIIYLVLSVAMIPAITRALKELKKEPEPYCCPGDETFVPRKLAFVREKKHKKAE